MMHFTLEHLKQFTRITTRLQRILQTTDIWRPYNSEGDVIKSVSSQEYEIVTSSVKDILIGERTVEPRNGSVFYEIVLFAENNYYLKKNRDRFLVFEKDLAELLKYFGIE